MVIVQEPTAGEVSSVSGQFSGDANVSFAILEAVNRTDVVQATTGYKATRWRVSTRHDPRRAQGNGVDFVGGVRVPDNQLSILTGRHQISRVTAPVHSIDLGQVASQCAPGPHLDSSNRFQAGRRLHQACVACCLSRILYEQRNKQVDQY